MVVFAQVQNFCFISFLCEETSVNNPSSFLFSPPSHLSHNDSRHFLSASASYINNRPLILTARSLPISQESIMKSVIRLLLLCVLTFNLSIFSFARPQQMFTYPFHLLARCSSTTQCNLCQANCPTSRPLFFSSSTSVNHFYDDHVSDLFACRRRLLRLRNGLSDWCINDENGFYAIDSFIPTTDSCFRYPAACAVALAARAEERVSMGKLSNEHRRVVLARKILQLAMASEEATRAKKGYEEARIRADAIKKAWDEKWYDVAIFHLEQPDEKVTRFADPVFVNYSGMLRDVEIMDASVSSNDLKQAYVENKFVRKETISEIPKLMHSIFGLRNEIVSKKHVTDAYLKEIKELTTRTFELQQLATNIIYETTHSAGLDGEIVLLDRDLFNLYIALKKERADLSNENVQTTFSKLRLVGMMRQLVLEISKRQRADGCSDADRMLEKEMPVEKKPIAKRSRARRGGFS